MDVNIFLQKAVELEASGVHFTVGVPPMIRLHGQLVPAMDYKLMPADTFEFIKQLASDEQVDDLERKGEVDFSYSIPNISRFRVNAYRQRNSYSIVLRVIKSAVPQLEELGLPPVIKELAMKKRGLILVTGPTGSGKSTTLASMIDYMNKVRNAHILTLEDPIEYLHKHNKSIVNQREIGSDSRSFANALRAALRQDPDVILVGEMRDLETISIAVTAAETGHLVLSTLHTTGATKTMDRIIDAFSSHQQAQIRAQLATVLEGVISQQLVPTANGRGRAAALEILIGTPAIRSMVREGKNHQINTAIQTGSQYGMKTMDMALVELYRQGKISRETAVNFSTDKETISKLLQM